MLPRNEPNILAYLERIKRRYEAPGGESAFLEPVLKTAPFHFATVEDAENEGWTFDPGLGRWAAPDEFFLLSYTTEK